MSEPNGHAGWFVFGHGSVGSFLCERLQASDADVFIFDPAPRIPIRFGVQVEALPPPAGEPDYVVSCVPPAIASQVASRIAETVGENSLVFEWNTISPEAKRRIAKAVPSPVIDVALLDSLDTQAERPVLALSGKKAHIGAEILGRHGFDAVVVGDEPGQAAALKFLRSIFMKGLEALVLEYESVAADIDGEAIVRHSLENNLGERFVQFMDLLLRTNRIHAKRRGQELSEAIASLAHDGDRPELSTAASHVLERAAEAWQGRLAPPIDAERSTLARYLYQPLWRQSKST